MDKGQQLVEHLTKHLPHVHYVTPTSPDYAELREAFIIDNPVVPIAIARPKSAEDVAALVQYAVTSDIEISVRTGGHDLWGRCFAHEALAIDMRDIAFVHVADDRCSARIGGGTLTGDLVTTLAEHKVATATGNISSVGYVGWATHGGYGPFLANFGLGVDQIIGARLVNHEGEIVLANTEVLRAIRGGGGTLGVIVELTIKIYPLDKILGGVIVFESKDLVSTIERFESGYREMAIQGLPDALNAQHIVANTPMGKCFTVSLLWSSSDCDEGHKHVDKISTLGTPLYSGVKETTIPEWLKESEAFVPKSAYGCNCSVNVREMTDEVVKIMAQEIPKMPDDPATIFSTHQLRRPSAKTNDESVFGARTPHYLFDLVSISSDAGRARISWDWAKNFRDALQSSDPQNVLPTTYICLTHPAEASLEMIYQENRDKLVEIKKRYDPDNVFRHALPQF